VRAAGLAKKGSIARGFDADLVVWDPEASFEVTASALFFRHKVTPYLGQTLQGRVQRTYLRGEQVYDGAAHRAGPIGNVLLHRASEP
jgi:allantoinase